MDDGGILVEEDVMLRVREDICVGTVRDVLGDAAGRSVGVYEVVLASKRGMTGSEVGCVDGEVLLVNDESLAIGCLTAKRAVIGSLSVEPGINQLYEMLSLRKPLKRNVCIEFAVWDACLANIRARAAVAKRTEKEVIDPACGSSRQV